MSVPARVLCLAGPTGVGKTAAALALCEAVNAEVINADSRQVYADFPCITAQPSVEERTACAHHLYGFLPTAERISAGNWLDRVVPVAQDVLRRGKVPLFVGGTGLYFKVLLEGIAQIPPIAQHIQRELLQRLDNEGIAPLYALAQSVDPTYVGKLHPNDKQRILRVLEVWYATGKPLSWWHVNRAGEPAFRGCMFGLDCTLDILTPHLARRIDVMLDQGAVAEAERAKERCNDGCAPGWTGIGCAELWQYLEGTISLVKARELWLHNTRAYAKRQRTWFKAVKEILWYKSGEISVMCDAAKKFIIS